MLSSFSRPDHRREALSVPWHPSRWRRPTHAGLAANALCPIRFVVSASRSFARPCRRWSTTRASAEAAASGALRTPEITPLKRYPLNVNDLVASKRIFEAFAGIFHRSGLGRGPVPAGEDFGSFGTEWNAPSAFWVVGGTDADTYAKGIRQNQLTCPSIIAHSLHR